MERGGGRLEAIERNSLKKRIKQSKRFLKLEEKTILLYPLLPV
jgi:hypothetical protein